jgi:hypothetical protein
MLRQPASSREGTTTSFSASCRTPPGPACHESVRRRIVPRVLPPDRSRIRFDSRLASFAISKCRNRGGRMPAAELAAGASFFVETAGHAQSKPEEGRMAGCSAKSGTADPRWPPWYSLAEKVKSKKVAVFVLNKRNRQFEFTPLRESVLNVVDSPERSAKLPACAGLCAILCDYRRLRRILSAPQ